MTYNFFATAPKGLELLLVDELRVLGASQVAEKLAGVQFSGDLGLAYKACLWSRLANRILLKLHEGPATTPAALYTIVQAIDWSVHIDPVGTIAVHCVCSQSEITHSLFAAQKVKDAIVDQLRARFGVRPNVAREKPQVNIDVYLHRNHASISIDLSGESLHKRGYRLSQTIAPLKENLAAAILMRAGYSKIIRDKGTLMDPMCGSGTLLIEAAMLAGKIAPGLYKTYFGFQGWLQHQEDVWQNLVAEAKEIRVQEEDKIPPIIGYDHDPIAIKSAFENIERAGLRGKIHVEKRDLIDFAPMVKHPQGLVIVNPPYGERLGEIAELKITYRQLGECLKKHFLHWQASVLTANDDLAKEMGIRALRYYHFYNGMLPCKLLLFAIETERFVDQRPAAENKRLINRAQQSVNLEQPSPTLQIFINRLRKNLRHFGKRARRQGITQYCVYDNDLPDYAFHIEIGAEGVTVTENAASHKIPGEKLLRHRQEVLAVLPDLLAIDKAAIWFIDSK